MTWVDFGPVFPSLLDHLISTLAHLIVGSFDCLVWCQIEKIEAKRIERGPEDLH